MTFDLTSFIYLDRFRNEGTRTYSELSEYTEAREEFRHNADHKGFDLPFFGLPREKMNIYRANPPAPLLDKYVREDEVCFPVHPQILSQGHARNMEDPYLDLTRSLGRKLMAERVIPSASTRTLFLESAPQAIKVHFPFRISRYGRRMRDEVVAQAVAVSMEMEKGIACFDPGFAFMREVLGITHQNLDPDGPRGENWGFLVRDLHPFPRAAGPGRLIPGFALYGRDFFTPETPPLILDLIRGSDPVAFILEKIMIPVIRQWIACYLNFGFFLEPHGQNLILETDDRMNITRMVHRDLSVAVDMHRRRHLGLSSSHLNTYNRMEDGTFGSIAYDKFMGHHFFDFLAACVIDHYPGVHMEDFTLPCKAAFQKAFPDHAKFLPATEHYFTRQRDCFGKPRFKNLGHPPKWRP